MTNYGGFERELHSLAARRDFERRSSGTAGDYHHERQRDGHADVNLDRVPSGGGEAARWAASEKAPEWLDFGDHVFAYDLKCITERCGPDVAAAVDVACGPCQVCAINTYGGMICHQCDDQDMSVAEMDADSAGYPGYSAYAGGVRGDNGRGLSNDELVF